MLSKRKLSDTEQQAQYQAGLALLKKMRETAALLESGEDAQVLQALQEMLQQNPLEGWAHVFAGVVLTSLGRTAEAMAEYGITLALEPDNPLPYRNLGFLLRLEGRTTLAEQVLENGWKRRQKIMRNMGTEDERREFLGIRQDAA